VSVVTGANAIPVGFRAPGSVVAAVDNSILAGDKAPCSIVNQKLPPRRSVFERIQFPPKILKTASRSRVLNSSARKSVFKRLQFAKRSVFDRLSWNHSQRNFQLDDWKQRTCSGSTLDCSSEDQLQNGLSGISVRQSVPQPQINVSSSPGLNLDLNLKLDSPLFPLFFPMFKLQ